MQRHRELLALSHRRQPGHPRRRSSNTCPTTPSFSSTRATSPFRRSARCTGATSRRKATLAEYGFRLPSCMEQPPAPLRGSNAMRRPPSRSRPPPASGAGGAGGVFAETGSSARRASPILPRSTSARQIPGRRPPRRDPRVLRPTATARSSPCSPSAWPRTSPNISTSRASACATCTRTSTPWSASRSSGICASAPRRPRRHQPPARGLDIPECGLVAILRRRQGRVASAPRPR